MDAVEEVQDAEEGRAPEAAAPTPEAQRLFWATVGAVLVAIAVATVRGLARGWRPIGDNAYFLIRSRDVLTEHHPLLGTWTSASQNTPTNFNNPGPLMFDLLALPAKLGGGTGLAVGVAVLNGLAVLGIALMARRRGGPLVGATAVAVCALLCWTMGSELLYDPWQPHSLLLPFLFGLVCVWSLVDGDLLALPWGLATASLIVQTHLSYAVLVVVLGVWGIAGLALALRGERRAAPERWAERRRSVVAVVGISLVVVGLCWLQPLIENVTADDEGNLQRLAGNMAAAEQTVGVDLGTRVVADTVVLPPFWLRPSFAEALTHDIGVVVPPSVDPSFPVAALLLGVLGVVMAAATADAVRRRDRVSWSILTTAGLTLACGLVTSTQLPLGVLGIAAHQFRWMWPTAAFATLALGVAVLRRAATTPGRVRGAAIALAALTVVVALATLPTYNVEAGPVADLGVVPTMDEAARQMQALEGEGTLVIDMRGTRFAEPYTGPVMAELQRRGIPFVVEDEGMVRQLGESRRREEGEEIQRLLFREGDQARAGVPGARRVVYVEGLTAAEQAERDELLADLVDHLATAGLDIADEASLTAAERAALPPPGDTAALTAFVPSRTFMLLVADGDVELEAPWRERFDRYDELRRRWAFHTFGLFLAPDGWDDGGG